MPFEQRDDEARQRALALLSDALAREPSGAARQIRYRAPDLDAVGRVGVQASADEVHLVIRLPTASGAGEVAGELSMSPEYARCLAALLNSHALYVQSRAT